MVTATFRFYGELNDFVPHDKRQQPLTTTFNPPETVKHLIEAAGVPHPEVEIILVNGQSVDFAYLVQPDDRVAVYPMFETIDVSPLLQLRPFPPHPPRFILDCHLGQLAMYLRLCGFDTLYRNDYDDEELAEVAGAENRVLLTRDRRLLMRKLVTYGYWMRSKDPRQQLTAVLHRYHLLDKISSYSRCLKCNGRLHPIAKEAILDRLEPKTRLYYDEFHICQECEQIYWKGSHYQSLQELIAQIKADSES